MQGQDVASSVASSLLVGRTLLFDREWQSADRAGASGGNSNNNMYAACVLAAGLRFLLELVSGMAVSGTKRTGCLYSDSSFATRGIVVARQHDRAVPPRRYQLPTCGRGCGR